MSETTLFKKWRHRVICLQSSVVDLLSSTRILGVGVLLDCMALAASPVRIWLYECGLH